MMLLLSGLVAVLYAGGIYLLFRRSLIKLVLGLVLLGHAANLLIFVSGGLSKGKAPLVEAGAKVPPEGAGDPLPMALVLTAIVISFAICSFAIVLIRRVYQEVGSDDLYDMTDEEPA